MCIPSSVPANFGPQLTEYTQRGYRVIAMAGKALPGMSWQEVTSFGGSILFLLIVVSFRLEMSLVRQWRSTWFFLDS